MFDFELHRASREFELQPSIYSQQAISAARLDLRIGEHASIGRG
jgi:hypothetical protein